MNTDQIQSPQELTSFVEQVLKQLSVKFEDMRYPLPDKQFTNPFENESTG